jgi:hypothetical protein
VERVKMIFFSSRTCNGLEHLCSRVWKGPRIRSGPKALIWARLVVRVPVPCPHVSVRYIGRRGRRRQAKLI